eukprot:scaffold6566_cov125-Amphora_coffeaeformis.AAC.12
MPPMPSLPAAAATTTSFDNNTSNSTTKKRKAADALGRLATSARGGRGAVVGWTTCPLCHNGSSDNNKNNVKRFALGRGIAAHLHAVHTPWKKPGKAQQRKRRRLAERLARQQGITHLPLEQRQQQDDEQKTWEPSQAERQAWDARVLELVQQVEQQQQQAAAAEQNTTTTTTKEEEEPKLITRNGQVTTSYRASLPPLVQAAADGKLEVVQEMMEECSPDNRLALLQTRDRHGSMAEHWAAGEGHLECLKYLVNKRQTLQSTKLSSETTTAEGNSDEVASCTLSSMSSRRPKKVRRRDGKTPLHYAARHGRLACVKFLLIQTDHVHVNAPSGDGTTPLHMACYGAQYDTVRYLCDEAGADVRAANAWGCTAAHWLSMCQKKDVADSTRKLCDWLAARGVAFHVAQAQGHSACHKAAQHLNITVLKWMAANLSAEQKREAAQPDMGGHTPWEICQSVGGDIDLVNWVRMEFGGTGAVANGENEESTPATA